MSHSRRWTAAAAAVVLSAAALGSAPAQAGAGTPTTTLTWGSNSAGELGDGTKIDSTTPRLVAGDHDFIGLASGSGHGAALGDDGTVWTWGTDFNGQLGTGAGNGSSTVPVQVPGLAQIRQVSSQGSHTLALRADGEVFSWGGNIVGQLGDGTTTQRDSPVKVNVPATSQVSAGLQHSLFLSFGNVYASGYNLSGQLGDGSTATRLHPVPIKPVGLPLGGFTQVAAANFGHSLALRGDGSVWAWGGNHAGQLGDGTTTNRLTAVRVGLPPGIIRIAAGHNHSMALRSDGTVWTWGFNCCGQIGDGTTSNRIIAFRVPGLTGITKISAGGDMSAAVRNDGTVWTWGRNLGGELGDGTTTNRTSPVQVSGLSGAIEVAAGSGSHTGAITAPDATPDFTIDTPYHPTTIHLIPSFNTSALVTTHARYGSNQLINLTASISPPTPGITTTFNSPAVIAGAASTVTMQVDESVPAGTYTITFTGTAGGTVHSTSFPLTLTRTHNPGGDPEPEPEPEDPPCNPKLGCP